MLNEYETDVYRTQGEQWRCRAERMPTGAAREIYQTIAEGYSRLASLNERDKELYYRDPGVLKPV